MHRRMRYALIVGVAVVSIISMLKDAVSIVSVV